MPMARAAVLETPDQIEAVASRDPSHLAAGDAVNGERGALITPMCLGDSGRIAIDQLLAEVREPPRVAGVFTDVVDAALLEWGADAWESRGAIGIALWGSLLGCSSDRRSACRCNELAHDTRR
jgi:hypothetical protein